MKKESSRIKSIFESLASQKNEQATEEIENKKFKVTKISSKDIKQSTNLFDLDN